MAIVGAGFTGLAAAYELAKGGWKVTLIEAEDAVGGLAGTFEADGVRLEKFYHHWFTTDEHVIRLIDELGLSDRLVRRETTTSLYRDHHFYRLSVPMDLLKFTPLRFRDRVKLSLLGFKANRIKDWRELESMTIEQWLTSLTGAEVYRVVWEPLLRGKFGDAVSTINAAWMWSKLKQRGGSRGKGGAEVLAYFRGGLGALAGRIAEEIRHRGGQVFTNAPATGLIIDHDRAKGVQIEGGSIYADHVLLTPALPIVADLVEPHLDEDYVNKLTRIDYLANVCLVLQLDEPLIDTYWLNISDPDFPFVGVCEHTNLAESDRYHGRHVVYFTQYLRHTDPMYRMSPPQLFDFAMPHIERMFPGVKREQVRAWHAWRARYAQPIVTQHYGDLIPEHRMPAENLWLSTMAQIYPEDRGTNYAIREGRNVARLMQGRAAVVSR